MTNVFKPTNFLIENTLDSNMLVSLLPVEQSYYTEALDFIRSSQRDMYKERKVFYKSVLESNGDLKVINEKFEGLANGFKKIIDAILKFIKAMYNKFITAINSLIKSDKYIISHKNDFSKFNDTKHKFTFKGYKYTFSEEIPIINAVSVLDNEFELNFKEVDISNMDAVKKHVEEKAKQFKESLDGFYDTFRGTVLNSSSPISSSDFSEALIEAYRDDSSTTSEIDVNSFYISEAIQRFSTNNKDSDACKKTKGKIEREYKDIKTKLDHMVKRNYDSAGVLKIDIDDPENSEIKTGLMVNENIITKINSYIKAKQDQVQEMGNIHTAAFAAKLDAYKQCMKQDKQILYKALSKIHGTIREFIEPDSEIDYVFESKVFSFRNDTYEDKQDLNRYIQECLILSDYTSRKRMTNLAALNEGAADTIKSGIRKVHDFIKKIWAKFVEKMDSFISKDKTYLEKYKDIILKKKPIDATYTMKNYEEGIKNIVNTSVPVFNYEGLKDKLVSENDFTKFLVAGKKPEYDPSKQNFVDYCKELFTGGSDTKEVNATQLNMTNLYNYCYEYNDLKNKIEKDSVTIESAVKAAENVINGIAPSASNTPANTPTAPAGTEQKPADSDQTPKTEAQHNSARNFFWFDKGQAYSTVYEAVITEIERTVNGKPEQNSTSGSSPINSTQSPAKQATNINTGGGDKEDDAEKVKASVVANGDSEKKLDEAKDKIMIYMNGTQNLFAAKLTASEEIYKSYMQIIRMHVKDHLGVNNTPNKSVQTGTNYASLSEEEKRVISEYIGSVVDIKNMSDKDAKTKLDNAIKNIKSDSEKNTLIGGVKKLFRI